MVFRFRGCSANWILRAGARDLIRQAVEAEFSALLEAHAGNRTGGGRAGLVRHGHLPEREVMTGIGAVPVKVPRVRDRGDDPEKVRVTSTILPPYFAQSQIHRGAAALAVPQGHFHRRLSRSARCFALAERGRSKELMAMTEGYRESTQRWLELLLDLQPRGLTRAPDLAIGGGALGVWNALREIFGATKEQRCWFHKTGNVSNAMPKSARYLAVRNPRGCRGRF